ncbi:uncharacterized protein K02A2.6-like [Monomorium pharaonis]|uniref:uncharacterized protein K02A2.6-like n=1 Tax=Monomorium pharaonis TaxID=307658 RepID=UPI00063FC3AD|nr:uncharacterized protein K02A2.6-like [Monomorium pharaonis]
MPQKDLIAILKELFGDKVPITRPRIEILNYRYDKSTPITEQKTLENTTKQSQIAVLNVARAKPKQVSKRETAFETTKASKAKSTATTTKCNGCGGAHPRVKCTFRDAVCHKCSVKGHIAKVCRAKPKESEPVTETKSVVTHSLSAIGKRRRYVTMSLLGKTVTLQYDTDSDITVIGKKDWIRIGSPKLAPSDTIKHAGGSKLDVLGKFHCTISALGCESKIYVYVASRDEVNLFRLNAIDDLNLWSVLLSDLPRVSSAPTPLQVTASALASANQTREQTLKPTTSSNCTKVASRHNACLEDALRRFPDLFAEDLDTCRDFKVANSILQTKLAQSRFHAGVNSALIDNRHPLPTVESITSKLNGNRFFSLLNLSDAFFQLEIDEVHREITTMTTQKGLFRFKRLPFGIKTAPAIFQQAMDATISGLVGVYAYLDERLQKTLQRLQDQGWKLKIGKCKFALEKIKYLRSIVNAHGISVDPEATSAIVNMPKPTSVSEVQTFLRMVNHYGKFIPHLHQIKQPLEDLTTSKNQTWSWNRTYDLAIEQIKKVMLSPLLLEHFDPSKTLIVAADACATGIGAVLLQRDSQGHERAVYHMAQSLTDAQRNYSQLKKEALALVTAIERFHKYGPLDVLVTDHGTQFTSELFDTFCRSHLLSAVNHPQSNGQAERMVDIVKRAIAKDPTNWKKQLLDFLYSYRYTPCLESPMGKSLAELLFRRRMNSPFTKWLPSIEPLEPVAPNPPAEKQSEIE